MKRILLTLSVVWISTVCALGQMVGGDSNIKTGPCGENLTYEVNVYTNTLTISGTGRMHDYEMYNGGFEEWGDTLPGWFYHRDYIKKIELGEGVTNIGNWAFYGCENLTEVKFATTIKNIGGAAFENCTSLTNVDLPNKLKSIGGSAFYNCTSLSEINFPNSVDSIGHAVCMNCENLNKVTINSDCLPVYSFYDYNPFYQCDNITTVSFVGDCTRVPNTFQEFNKLSKVTLGNKITTIVESAFYRCESLTEITLPNSVTTIEDDAFRYSGLESIVVNSDIDFRSGVFYGTNLTTVNLGGDCTKVPNYAFGELEKLSKVTLGNKITTIGDYAFASCSSLTEITMSNSITTIGNSAFYGCSSLTGITLPNSVATIGESAFYGCSSLTEITLPNSVATIGWSTFEGCASLTEITLPNSVATIGRSAFEGCASLKEIILPNGVTTIEDIAFKGCASLNKITLPNSVTTIGVDVFSDCSSLPVIDNVRYADTYLIGVTDRTKSSYKIVEGTRFIGSKAFIRCSEMTEFIIPESVEYIGENAFSGTSLTFIEIPKNLKCVGNGAFGRFWLYDAETQDNIELRGCPLRSIVSKSIYPSDVQESYDNYEVFDDYAYIHAPLYVPEGAYWNYAYAPGWGDFIHIKEMATEVGSLQSRKAYMIADSKGCNYKVYDAGMDEMKTVEYTHALDEESKDCCWTVMKENGNTYLYNLGANKFGVVANDGAITLSETPVNVVISENENGLRINGVNCMFVLNKNVEVEVTGIDDVLLNGTEMKNAQIHSLDGRSQQGLTRGINIVNGKKVLVK